MSAVNGLELKTPGECGYDSVSKFGNCVERILCRDGEPFAYILLKDKHANQELYKLVKLPAPKKYRPYRREEVRCGDVFRHKATGKDRSVNEITDDGVGIGCGAYSYQELLERFDRLTLSPYGEECLGVAGVEES